MRYSLLLLLSIFSFNTSAYDNEAGHYKALAGSAALAAKDEHVKVFDFKVSNIFRDTRITHENLADASEHGAYQRSSQQNDLSKLTALRLSLNLYFNKKGSWPDKKWMKSELQSVLLQQGASSKLWAIQNYWKSSSGFYLLLKNSVSGSTIKMEGDRGGGVSWE
ncbi:MAG: hypothetical protein ACC635_03455 [Acidiferrobacterales bacterium]